MNLDKFIASVEKALDRVEDIIDGKDSNSVWASTTRTGGTPVGSRPVTFQKADLEFVFDAAEANESPVIRKAVKRIREKYGL